MNSSTPDFAAPVAIDDRAVALLEHGAVERALARSGTPPSLVAVEREQRVIEIEQREDVGGHERGRRIQSPNEGRRHCTRDPRAARAGARRAAASTAAFRVDGQTVGWLDAARAARLSAFASTSSTALTARSGFAATLADCGARTAAVDEVTRALAGEGLLSAWRDERYAVARRASAPRRWSTSSAPRRAISASAPTPRTSTGWCAAAATWRCGSRGAVRPRRSIPACSTTWSAAASPPATASPTPLRKEAWEEAGIPADRRRAGAPARQQSHICRAQPDGLQRETVFVHDLELDADFSAGEPGRRSGRAPAADDVRRGATDRRRRGAMTQSRPTRAWSSSTACFATARSDRIAPDIRALSAFRHAMLEPAPRRNGRGAWPGGAQSWLTRP